MTVHCLIVAAGVGARAGAGLPKQYRPLGGQPLLRWSAERLSADPAIASVRVVIQPDHQAAYDAATEGLPLSAPVTGADSRQGSVLAGLNLLETEASGAEDDIVLIHDAARPFVTRAVTARLLAALDTDQGAIPSLPVVDSLRQGKTHVEGEVAREGLHRVQTPQAFRLAPLLAAHRAAVPGATDDAEIARAAGLSVALVKGDEGLFKLTYEDDFQRAERLLAGRGFRTGTGFDVHRFEPGGHVTLCGVAIPHGAGLKGHSDADVGLHALVDALLGALAAGDIGDHFPPSDPQWRGAPSAEFVEHARRLVAAAGGVVEHADITLICERPKVGPYKEQMRRRIAQLLRVEPGRISVKATTTERLGFTGRGEGIAAQAAATIRI
ncbi:bifunctional 2-C-methyl-D-erythritol 4-phosphate cytidylyltransferase/2-C-methyl-D-erythritol 2,4-cyclodiphosphate synthase [Pacificimonas flava]|uniref:Bifunctional enzyme IspD/IspF n=2 Tax=Pacificimonas TaxID=1960290 RepID=A0A219B6E2_9SPHN|nr:MULTISPECIES: bifunctional 2-C-methyl-D-erythritol 4-phosphate cytidylyltransferase/2-C-methyl-D-erythritol 2,4-cyclodiphosphate synthase [Pacificimonas]MBZ6378810.1 bifunctional 2-C-methyl-D-erythritol 4-phosphate cytidylyltransferase/2-C-methyl-D-erythritol 2,4-cyclodiphosphate synthase [Pacificimonas aurantium]OWV33930.1 bifunctional 2-C-methyl-D-erythritol 4-phosphate cytidylyltransferase/2-C-methyl-D-erythritol 2,4-cyclodiphosphate synthase [Pacificimonas flava]